MEKNRIGERLISAGFRAGPAAVTVRRAGGNDLELLEILERESQLHPWSTPLFREEFENPHSRVDLLLLNGEPAGYLCYHFLLDEISIINLAVSPRFRRQGVARHLLECALGAEQGAEKGYLEVRTGNAGAIALYRSFGFRVVGTRKRYYADGEDALLMEWSAGH